MAEETPKNSNRSVVSCDAESKAFFLELQRDFMRTHGAQVSQEKIVAKLIEKSGLTLADLAEFAPVIAETEAA